MHENITEILGGDATLRVVGQDDALGEFATEILGEDDTGAWFHRLNPAYWLKDKRERSLIDAEKKFSEQAKDEQKWLKSREKQLKAGEKAASAAEAARAAHAKSDEAENRLKEIESQLSGAFVGADEATQDALAEHVVAAQEGQVAARKNSRRAGSILAKIEAGEKLTPEDVSRLKSCLRVCKALRQYHDDLHAQVAAKTSTTTSGYRDPDKIDKTVPSASFLAGATTPLTKDRWIAMIAITAAKPTALAPYMKKHGINLSRVDQANLSKMAKVTRAKMARQAAVSGVGLDVWSGIKKASLLPIAAHTWGTRKTLGLLRSAGRVITSPLRSNSSSSAPSTRQAQASRIAAARARRLAALKRSQAANAKTLEAQREAQAQADAAQAEADAAQAEADAADTTAEAEEAQYDTAEATDDGEDVSGDFVGSFVGAEEFKGGWVSAVQGENDKKVIAAAASDSKTGKKIRAGATVVRAARKGDPKARKAISKVAAKAKAGNVQAKRDLTAIRAGDKALKIKAQAHGRAVAHMEMKASTARKAAVTTRLEAAAATRLARMSRKRQLMQVAKVEHKAASGDHRAKAAIANAVSKAKSGDKKAKTTVAALQLARRTRLAAATPSERKNLAAAGKVIRKARAGNRDAIKRVRVVQAAARAGQPNARRAVARLQTAAALEHAVATGKIRLPPGRTTQASAAAASKKRYAHFKKRALSSNGTREEAIAAAREAQKLGMKEEAANLAAVARRKPSATMSLKNAATTAAAAKQGSAEARGVVAAALGEAEKGNRAGIKSAGNLAAVHALNEVKSGRPLPLHVAEGVNIVRSAQAGDPEAKRTVERASAAAELGDKAGVAAAVSLTAGAALLAATASRPGARAKLIAKANDAQGISVLPADKQAAQVELMELYSKVQRGEASRSEAERGRQLALGLGNARLAAEISALMPPVEEGDPRSSLPDFPQAGIEGAGSLIKESLKALLFATRDPFANYREGVKSRGEKR